MKLQFFLQTVAKVRRGCGRRSSEKVATEIANFLQVFVLPNNNSVVIVNLFSSGQGLTMNGTKTTTLSRSVGVVGLQEDLHVLIIALLLLLLSA